MKNNTVQEMIREILIDDSKVDNLRDLPVESSVGSSMYLYDFMNSSYSNNKFELLLQYNEIDEREFLSLKIIPLQGDKTKPSSCNIFLDEDYNSDLILYTNDSYIDGCYMNEDDYQKAINELNSAIKYNAKLFEFNKNSFLLDEEQYIGIHKIVSSFKTQQSTQELHDFIEENNLSRYYVLLSNIVKIPKLENLNSRGMFQNENKLDKVVDEIMKIESLLINSQEKIESFRNNNEYKVLMKNDNLMSSYIKANTTELFLLNRAQNNISVEIINKQDLLGIIQSFNYKTSHVYSYLNSNDLSLLSSDINNDDSDSSFYIVAKNENNEVMGVLLANKFSKYEYNNSKYDDEVLNITSVSTSMKFRGLGISSILFEELMKYSKENDLAVRVSMPTIDNKNHIANKMDALEKKYSSDVFIIPYNETDIYNIFKTYLNKNNLEDTFPKINNEFKEVYNKLIIHLKEKGVYPKGRDESFHNFVEVRDYLDTKFEKIKVGNTKQRKPSQ